MIRSTSNAQFSSSTCIFDNCMVDKNEYYYHHDPLSFLFDTYDSNLDIHV